MHDDNIEGLVGTENGSIFYVKFDEEVKIKLVSSNNKHKDQITCLKFDPALTKIFVCGTGSRSEELKMLTNDTCDEVMNFKSNFEEEGHVVFVISNSKEVKSKK